MIKLNQQGIKNNISKIKIKLDELIRQPKMNLFKPKGNNQAVITILINKQEGNKRR